MSNIDDKLSEKFGIDPMESQEGEVLPAVQDQEHDLVPIEANEKIENDYEHSRGNLRSLLVQGQEALVHALEVAKQSEHPRAFEVVGNLVKQLADVNQQLLDLHTQKKKLDEPRKGEQSKVTNNNAIFVGSTAEMQKLINNMNKGEK